MGLTDRQVRLQARKAGSQSLIVANVAGRKVCKLVPAEDVLVEAAKMAKKANALYCGPGATAYGPGPFSWTWSRSAP